jgi:hypothetical protein
VRVLIKAARLVVIDASDKSGAIEKEITLIDASARTDDTIWIEEETSTAEPSLDQRDTALQVIRWRRSWLWAIPRLGIAMVVAATATFLASPLSPLSFGNALFADLVPETSVGLLLGGGAVTVTLVLFFRMLIRPGLDPEFRRALKKEIRGRQ